MEYDINNYAVDRQFVSNIFRFNRSDFLSIVTPVFDEYVDRIKSQKKSDDIYPGIMTELLSKDERLFDFVSYVCDISWDILSKQGYNMDLYYTSAHEMWGQYHPRTSGMEKHSHGQGSYISGFYFIETPPSSSVVTFYDPRSVKTHINLPLKETNILTDGHTSVWYEPKPGDFIFTDSWLEHSFTRNQSHQPYKFIHFNVSVVDREQDTPVVV